MARIPYLDTATLAPEHHDLLARDLNLYRALANSPATARNFQALGMHIRHDMALDPRLRELAIIQVGYTTKAPYEYSHHIEIGRAVGVTDDDLHAVALESAGTRSSLPALDHYVLRAARELSAGTELADATWNALARELDTADLLDLVMTISFYCGVVRLLGALRMDVEPAYRQLLEDFPLPQ